MRPEIEAFLHGRTKTISYVVADPTTKRAAVLDPVLDYDPGGGATATDSADRLIAHVENAGLKVDWLLETHIHADHLTAAPYLKERLGGRTVIGARITEVQGRFADIFNLKDEVPADGSQFDRLVEDGDRLELGNLDIAVLHTPGHTPACVSYLVGDALFVGDTIFMPDYGTARCDFPGGDPGTLFRSIRRLLALPPETRLFVGHDYAPGGRDTAWETTVGEQRAGNIHVGDGIGEADFVAMRTARDARLALPELILPAIQVNIRAGHLPPPEKNGRRYLKIPLNAF